MTWECHFGCIKIIYLEVAGWDIKTHTSLYVRFRKFPILLPLSKFSFRSYWPKWEVSAALYLYIYIYGWCSYTFQTMKVSPAELLILYCSSKWIHCHFQVLLILRSRFCYIQQLYIKWEGLHFKTQFLMSQIPIVPYSSKITKCLLQVLYTYIGWLCCILFMYICKLPLFTSRHKQC